MLRKSLCQQRTANWLDSLKDVRLFKVLKTSPFGLGSRRFASGTAAACRIKAHSPTPRLRHLGSLDRLDLHLVRTALQRPTTGLQHCWWTTCGALSSTSKALRHLKILYGPRFVGLAQPQHLPEALRPRRPAAGWTNPRPQTRSPPSRAAGSCPPCAPPVGKHLQHLKTIQTGDAAPDICPKPSKTEVQEPSKPHSHP